MLGRPVTSYTLVSNFSIHYLIKADMTVLNPATIDHLAVTVGNDVTIIRNQLTAESFETIETGPVNGFVLVGNEVYMSLLKSNFPYLSTTYLAIGYVRNPLQITQPTDLLDIPDHDIELYSALCLAGLYTSGTVPREILYKIDSTKGIV